MTLLSPEAWFAQLPTFYCAAAALFTDHDDRILLVKPNYRDHWGMPGGIVEADEFPHVGCRREVLEELGLDIEPGPLLVVDWSPPHGARPRAICSMLFDGGVMPADTPITLQAEELDDYAFVRRDTMPTLIPAFLVARVEAGLRARAAGHTIYLPA
jgi:8-oxo-dGTP diphosphatase